MIVIQRFLLLPCDTFFRQSYLGRCRNILMAMVPVIQRSGASLTPVSTFIKGRRFPDAMPDLCLAPPDRILDRPALWKTTAKGPGRSHYPVPDKIFSCEKDMALIAVINPGFRPGVKANGRKPDLNGLYSPTRRVPHFLIDPFS